MAGVLLNVVPKTTYDFSGSGNGTIPPMPIGDPIDVSQYTDVGMIVRLHDLSISSSNLISFEVHDDGFIDGNTTPFLSTDFSLAGQFVTANNTAPSALVSYVPVVGQYVSLTVGGTRSAAGPLLATVSIDVFLRSPDAATR